MTPRDEVKRCPFCVSCKELSHADADTRAQPPASSDREEAIEKIINVALGMGHEPFCDHQDPAMRLCTCQKGYVVDAIAEFRALPAPVDGWMPIESAPTNQNIWIWGFRNSEGPDPNNKASAYVAQKSSSGYFGDGRTSYGFCTHWMPYRLPAPPADGKESDNGA